MAMKSNRNIFLWILYDFANSIVLIVFFFYFAQWVVVERNISDLIYNLTFPVSTLFLLLTVPITGFLLDKYWRRITGLRYTTFLTSAFFALCAMAAIYDLEVFSLVLFTIGIYFYLLTFTFYTPLLNDIATPETIGKISGFGIAANYLGQITGLLISLPFSTGAISLFGSSPRVETLLPAVVLFTVLTLPMTFFFREPLRPHVRIRFKDEVRELLLSTQNLFRYSGVALFILTYFLLNNAILTASNNFPIFLEQVWGVSDTIKTYILLGILVTSGIGGWLSGLVADKYGHKRTLMVISIGWVVILPLVGFMTNFTLFVITTTAMGFWFGANWAVSRSVMSYLSPEGGHNLAFGYFGLIERASSFVGPIIWGSVVATFIHTGPFRYRLAILAVTGFLVLGVWALHKVRSDRSQS